MSVIKPLNFCLKHFFIPPIIASSKEMAERKENLVLPFSFLIYYLSYRNPSHLIAPFPKLSPSLNQKKYSYEKDSLLF